MITLVRRVLAPLALIAALVIIVWALAAVDAVIA